MTCMHVHVPRPLGRTCKLALSASKAADMLELLSRPRQLVVFRVIEVALWQAHVLSRQGVGVVEVDKLLHLIELLSRLFLQCVLLVLHTDTTLMMLLKNYVGTNNVDSTSYIIWNRIKEWYENLKPHLSKLWRSAQIQIFWLITVLPLWDFFQRTFGPLTAELQRRISAMEMRCYHKILHAAHAKTMLPTRKPVPKSSRKSDHTKTSWPS